MTLNSKVGIDFGTSKVCAAIYRSQTVEFIQNEVGSRVTPPFIAYKNNLRLVGDSAKEQLLLNTTTMFGAKRLIGRPYTDPIVQSFISHWPFTVANTENGFQIEITHEDRIKRFYSEELAYIIFVKMKELIEAALGAVVHGAVITVPPCFSNNQRESILFAAHHAGFTQTQLLNETTAAAITYRLNNSITTKRNILIFDLGAGSLNVSVVEVSENTLNVRAVASCDQLGGDYFTKNLVNNFLAHFTQQYPTTELDKRAIQRFYVASEKAKRTLAMLADVKVEIDSLPNEIIFSTVITRAVFEQMNDNLFKLIVKPVKQALLGAKMDKSAMHEIVLVGASTRIPKVQDILQEFFNGKQLNKSVNADEAVAQGAAALATFYCPAVNDIVPYSIGTITGDGDMDILIEKFTPIPTNDVRTFILDSDLPIPVYEGNSQKVKRNFFLGEYRLADFPENGTFDVDFHVDQNGILSLGAEMFLRRNHAHLTNSVVTAMKEETAQYQREENERRELMHARNNFEKECLRVKEIIENSQAHKYFEYVLKWIAGQLQMLYSAEPPTKEECVERQNYLQEEWTKLIHEIQSETPVSQETDQSEDSDL